MDDGEKKWVSATVTIDGVTIDDVGVRLKGNSTLSALRGGRGFPGGGEMPGDGPPGMPGQVGAQAPGPGGGPGGMMSMMAGMSADEPQTLPLLLSFDKYVEGRAYQGMTEIAVRPGTPVVNEAMALSLTADSGQPSQRFAYAVYSVNGSATSTRLLLEVPDGVYVQRHTGDGSELGTRGYLYKADATSRFAYVGEDQSDYSEQFTQINSADAGNLQPVIDLLRWVDEASDEEFAAHLADHVDVESFARYIATQNLLVNSDDMAGPGQNYYLWYNLDDGRFSVISWDLNLSMTGVTDAGPDDAITMGGGPAEGRGAPPQAAGNMPAPPEGGGMPVPPGGGEGAPVMGGNTLKSRFLESDAFTELYHREYWELYDRIYGNGHARDVLDGLASSIPISDALSAEELAGDIDTMRTWIDGRASALEDERNT